MMTSTEASSNYAYTPPGSSRLPPDGHEFPGDYPDETGKLRGRSSSSGGLWKGAKTLNGREERSERSSVRDKIALFTSETASSSSSNHHLPSTAGKKSSYPTLSCSVDNLTAGRSSSSPLISPVIRTLPRPAVHTVKTSVDLSERSRSLLDVASSNQRHSTGTTSSAVSLLQQRKNSLINLSEHQIRRNKSVSSKLRGLVIPDSSSPPSNRAALQLPEIISKDSVLVVGLSPLSPLRSPTSSTAAGAAGTEHDNVDGQQLKKTSTSLSSLPWKTSSPSVPKYSPAFKRKDLSVLRNYNATLLESTTPSTKPPPIPQSPPPPPCVEDSTSNSNSAGNDNSDTDGDSAVSSSRSSFSPSGSPVPERTAQQADSSSTSARILKAQSVEALNRKNVLQSARLSSGGSSSPVGATCTTSPPALSASNSSTSPLAASTAEAVGSRIERSAPRLRLSSSERIEVKTAFITDVCNNGSSSPAMTRYGSSPLTAFSTTASSSSSNVYRRPTKEVNSFRALAERWEAIANESPAASAATPSVQLTPSNAAASSSQQTAALTAPFAKKVEVQQIHQEVHQEPPGPTVEQSDISSTTSSSSNRNRAAGVMEIRQAFERVREELENAESSSDYNKPHSIFNLPSSSSSHHHYHHVRMSSLDSMTSEEGGSFSFGGGFFGGGGYGGQPFGVRDNYGSITSLASSTSLISPQELQQLLDEANQSLEESGTPSHEIVVVVLHRGDFCTSSSLSPGLGITLAGGADYETKEITIHKVIGGSVADRDGRVQKGDRVLSINGKGLKGVTHREALAILKAPRPEVVLVLSRNRSVSPQEIGREEDNMIKDLMPPVTVNSSSLTGLPFSHRGSVSSSGHVFLSNRPPRILESPLDFGNYDELEDVKRGPAITTTLVKDGAGLGFSLEGGKDSPLGDRPLTIKKIFTGGAASKNPTLRVGDQIISVNGCDVTSMSRIEAWNLMKKLPDGAVTLVIRQQISTPSSSLLSS